MRVGIIGAGAVGSACALAMSADERRALQRSADALKSALAHVGDAMAEHQPASKSGIDRPSPAAI